MRKHPHAARNDVTSPDGYPGGASHAPTTVSGLSDMLDPLLDQPLRKVGMVRRTLSADAAIAAVAPARVDRHCEHRLDRLVALVERGRDRPAGVAVHAQCQLRQVVRTDREAVEVLEEAVGEDRISTGSRTS